MAIKTKKKPNQNYSAKLADGRRVTVKDGVKTYSGGTTSTPSNSGGGSSSSKTNATSSQIAQVAAIKDTLTKIQASRSGGTSTPAVTPTAPASSYAGPSIIDFLDSTGQASDRTSRGALAEQNGITNYVGSAEQNTALLNKLRINTGGAIPSTAITNATTPQDVLDYRAKLQGITDTALKIKAELESLSSASTGDVTLGEEGTDNTNPITDPDKYLSRYFTTDSSRNLTPAQIEQKRLLDESAKETEGFYKDRDENIADAYDEYGVSEKQKALSNIQKEMAEREVKLRNDVQVLETAPEFRGVSREFAVDQREQIKSKGAFDLANLAIVESAYSGDLNTARDLAQDLIDNQFDTFEGKLKGYQARLAALLPQLNADEKKQALALEAAFTAQAQALADKKADTELKYEYMTLAAKAGAPESVYKSILKATSADEAFMLAAPYLKEESKSSGSGGGSRAPISSTASTTSPFTGTLATLDLGSTKTTINTLKNAIREQFAPEFSTKLISSLTDEQLRDFMIQYDAAQREARMNIDPEIVLKAYLEYIGKSDSGSGSSGGGNLDSRIDNAKI